MRLLEPCLTGPAVQHQFVMNNLSPSFCHLLFFFYPGKLLQLLFVVRRAVNKWIKTERIGRQYVRPLCPPTCNTLWREDKETGREVEMQGERIVPHFFPSSEIVGEIIWGMSKCNITPFTLMFKPLPDSSASQEGQEIKKRSVIRCERGRHMKADCGWRDENEYEVEDEAEKWESS